MPPIDTHILYNEKNRNFVVKIKLKERWIRRMTIFWQKGTVLPEL